MRLPGLRARGLGDGLRHERGWIAAMCTPFGPYMLISTWPGRRLRIRIGHCIRLIAKLVGDGDHGADQTVAFARRAVLRHSVMRTGPVVAISTSGLRSRIVHGQPIGRMRHLPLLRSDLAGSSGRGLPPMGRASDARSSEVASPSLRPAKGRLAARL